MSDSLLPRRPAVDPLEAAFQWSSLPPEHLRIALTALEPQLAREHEYRMEQLRLEARAEADRRGHVLYLGGLVAGFTIVVGMLTGAVVVGVSGQPWLAAMLAGPSVLALATLFVLRKADPAQTRAVSGSQRAAFAEAPPEAP